MKDMQELGQDNVTKTINIMTIMTFMQIVVTITDLLPYITIGKNRA